MQLIILAAGMGSRLKPITDNVPKGLVQVNGKSILEWQVDIARQLGITDICIVTGYKFECIDIPETTTIHNPQYNTTNMTHSLFCAQEYFKDEFVLSYGDIIYSKKIMEKLLNSNAPISIVVDDNWRSYWEDRFDNPLDDAESLTIANNQITSIGQKPTSLNDIESQYIGLMSFKNTGVASLVDSHSEIRRHNPSIAQHMYMTDLLQYMINKEINLTPVHISSGWIEIDSLKDLELAKILLPQIILS
jgi:L-glutamine-phosphate cytidylyltransferase